MAELVDALGSGPSSGNCVWVQIPFWATEMTGLLASLFCYMEAGAAGRKSVNCPMSIMLRTVLESKLHLISCVSHPICMRLLALEPRLHTVRLFSCFPLHNLCLREIWLPCFSVFSHFPGQEHRYDCRDFRKRRAFQGKEVLIPAPEFMGITVFTAIVLKHKKEGCRYYEPTPIDWSKSTMGVSFCLKSQRNRKRNSTIFTKKATDQK